MIQVTVHLRSYIAHPYWPEMERLVTIQKESGMNRARSSANRRKALEEYLKANQMTLANYEALEAAAQRPWHVRGEHIIIPNESVEAMLVATCDTIRAANRPCPPEMVRTVLRASSWETDASPEQGKLWERYAVVTSGTGAKLSNQRGLRRNWYVGGEPPTGEPTAKVIATGTLAPNPEMVKPAILRQALEWAGEWVGIGASRKMGWGRFELLDWSA